METTKLTLSVKADKIERAKKYAKEHHTSVSKLFDKFLDGIIPAEKEEDDPLLQKLKTMEIPEEIKSLTGILKGKYPDNFDYRDAKYEYLKEKYGL
ncbi:MAG: hypothetical protein EOP46_13150 [Sphingobacteriaceae bacterium]|nr:MAG: hypothetical protein EOP46_13150 [Sphingobacteriaceae bacterium]